MQKEGVASRTYQSCKLIFATPLDHAIAEKQLGLRTRKNPTQPIRAKADHAKISTVHGIDLMVNVSTEKDVLVLPRWTHHPPSNMHGICKN